MRAITHRVRSTGRSNELPLNVAIAVGRRELGAQRIEERGLHAGLGQEAPAPRAGRSRSAARRRRRTRRSRPRPRARSSRCRRTRHEPGSGSSGGSGITSWRSARVAVRRRARTSNPRGSARSALRAGRGGAPRRVRRSRRAVCRHASLAPSTRCSGPMQDGQPARHGQSRTSAAACSSSSRCSSNMRGGVADAARVDLVDGHGRKPGGDGAHLGDRAQVARVAHQPQARDVAQRVRHPLQPCLQRFAPERAPQVFVDGDPVAGRVKRLLGQVDRPRPDVLVRVEPDLLEHARERA